ncbi:MAG: ATP-dependent zinc protease [Gammaproteobacteria bacterium]|nr:MAG: ATP-dependent zinc protease [Gammaproteobacteria bacterium]
MSSPITIGWREWVSLPELGIPRLKTKVDTGARTSSLHACCVEVIEETPHQKQVRFIIHPQPKRFPEKAIKCIADLIDIREITDSGGHKENRCVIQTSVVLGTLCWPIEITLTSRDTMRFRMLLGRTALEQRFIVDPTHSYLYSKKTIIP